MKKELTVGAIALALTVGLVGTATAQDSGDSDVTVDVATDVAIDVRPSTLEYTGTGEEGALNPGDKRRVSDEDFKHIELENIGSETLNNIYVEATTAVNNSFGNQSANAHNTGNFVTISTETVESEGDYDVNINSLSDHHYVNRVEWFEDNPPTYIQTEPSTGSVEVDGATIDNPESRVGRFRVGGAEYFFVLYSNDFGSVTDLGVMIGREPHTPNQIGTTDFREATTGDVYEADMSGGPEDGNAYFDGAVELVSFNESNYNGGALINPSGQAAPVETGSTAGNISVDNPVDDVEIREYGFYYDVANGYVMRTAANVAPESTDGGDSWDITSKTGSGVNYIMSAGSESDALVPGQNFPLDIGVQVPLGVDKGRINQGTVTVNAEQY